MLTTNDAYDYHYAELGSRNIYDELMSLRDEQRQAIENAWPVIEGDKIPWELNPQGYTRWYMAPTMNDLIMNTLVVYIQRIPPSSRSGKQLIQGDQLAYIWKGSNGHSVIDGVRYPWDRGDILQIPARTDGCVVQHFNDGDDDLHLIHWMVNSAHSCGVDRGSGFEQIEACPEFQAANP